MEIFKFLVVTSAILKCTDVEISVYKYPSLDCGLYKRLTAGSIDNGKVIPLAFGECLLDEGFFEAKK